MDFRKLEDALNNGDFKEQIYSSLEGIYQISKVLDRLDLLKNFSKHDLEIIGKIEAIKNALAGYETSEQELKARINALVNSLEAKKQELEARINALVNSLEAKKQELEARLNTQLQSALNSEKEKLAQAGNELKTQLIEELTEAKNNLAQALKPQIQGVTKFLGFYVYGDQSYFQNQSDEFRELFKFADMDLKANRSYIVEFSMPYELSTDGIYSNNMGEMVLCLVANSKVYPIINSYYQLKTINLTNNMKFFSIYRTSCIFETPSEQAGYKIAVFARHHKDLWVNVNYTANTGSFETSFLTNAKFRGLTTQSIPTKYNNELVFYKHSQAIVYEIFQ